MKIGFVGLGKLGLPVALALEELGHEVIGTEINETRRGLIQVRRVPEAAHEPRLGELLAKSRLRVRDSLAPERPDVIMITVQTPHEKAFEGVTPLAFPPQDFDYTWLREAVEWTVDQVDRGNENNADRWNPLIVTVSTCLPGTYEREVKPILDGWGFEYAYNPLFIAMGSVIADFLDPEFILVGTEHGLVPERFEELYRPLRMNLEMIGGPPMAAMSITSAELTKVAYNAWLGYKIMLANGMAELSDKVGANCDDVMGTLMQATERLVSPTYMRPGMGDGGGCHPRDQIALSWLANKVQLSNDPYLGVIMARQRHADWLASIWYQEAKQEGLPMILLGDAYKANSTLTTGSHARLVKFYAELRGDVQVQNHIQIAPFERERLQPACYFFSVQHDRFYEFQPAAGSIVIDPWGNFPEWPGVEVVRPGRRA